MFWWKLLNLGAGLLIIIIIIIIILSSTWISRHLSSLLQNDVDFWGVYLLILYHCWLGSQKKLSFSVGVKFQKPLSPVNWWYTNGHTVVASIIASDKITKQNFYLFVFWFSHFSSVDLGGRFHFGLLIIKSVFPYPLHAFHILAYIGCASLLLNSYLDTNTCISKNEILNLFLCHLVSWTVWDFYNIKCIFFFFSMEDEVPVALVRAEALKAQ